MDFTITALLILKMLILVEGRKPPPEGKCLFTTVYKMLGADCSGINLVNIPPTTKKLEVLDASINRIRMLKNNSFTTYSSLKFLYLNDNPITIIEPYAFEPLENLEVLDLSLNAIRDLPALMPSTLRKLYVADNPLVSAPLGNAVSLQYVSMSKCLLTDLPYIGELPNLIELDISDNPLTNLNVSQIASFCHLQFLGVPEELFTPRYSSSCDCMRVHRWTVEHSIKVHPYFNCTVPDPEIDCSSNSTEELEAFNSCQIALQQQAVRHWALMGGGLAFIVLCAIILAFIWRRKRRVQQPQPHRTPDQEAAFRKRKLLEETPKSKF